MQQTQPHIQKNETTKQYQNESHTHNSTNTPHVKQSHA